MKANPPPVASDYTPVFGLRLKSEGDKWPLVNENFALSKIDPPGETCLKSGVRENRFGKEPLYITLPDQAMLLFCGYPILDAASVWWLKRYMKYDGYKVQVQKLKNKHENPNLL